MNNHTQSYPFIPPPEMPVSVADRQILFDFNDGARLFLPEGDWRVQISDEFSGNILFNARVKRGWVQSTKKYYTDFRLTVWQDDEEIPVLDHPMTLQGKEVLISFPTGTLGDLIGWVPYAERFRQKTGAIVVCTMARNILELFERAYPELIFMTPDDYLTGHRPPPYATWRIGLFFKGNSTDQPYDFRQVGLNRTAGHILGVDSEEIVPDLRLGSPRTIDGKYICIATMSTCQAKFWNNKTGWDDVITFLKAQGYRVLAIDRDNVVGEGFIWNRIPHGAEDFTGNIPLKERIALLEHADFFIGLGSGLSWLAWACHIPVIMISGFSLPFCEFKTPYRVINTHVCHGCWDDLTVDFDHHDFLWCPRHKGTPRQYECTRFITGKQVINAVVRVITDNNEKLQHPSNFIKENVESS